LESETLKIKDWLKGQEIEDGWYRSHKAAIIASSDPFGLFGSYKNGKTEYHYLNGKIDSVEHEGQTVRYN
jgi:hypothetical protein